MTVDLNNPEYEALWVPNCKWKHAFLIYLGQRFGLKTFVETGTHYGGTLKAMQPHFDQLYSIELSDHWYQHAIGMFWDVRNVCLIQGDSAIELPQLFKRLPNGPVLFWLDAHYSGGDTACAAEDPLAVEVQTIIRTRPDALIVIDDMKPGLGTPSFLEG
jgi:hypothetical protein